MLHTVKDTISVEQPAVYTLYSHKFIYIDQPFDYGGEYKQTHLTCENLTINKVTCILAQIVSPSTLRNTIKCLVFGKCLP